MFPIANLVAIVAPFVWIVLDSWLSTILGSHGVVDLFRGTPVESLNLGSNETRAERHLEADTRKCGALPFLIALVIRLVIRAMAGFALGSELLDILNSMTTCCCVFFFF